MRERLFLAFLCSSWYDCEEKAIISHKGTKPAMAEQKIYYIPQLTQQMISQSRVIAKGKRIRDVQRLVNSYGGIKSKWVKKSSPAFEIAGHFYEYHWYEHRGLGRFEIKRKKVS